MIKATVLPYVGVSPTNEGGTEWSCEGNSLNNIKQ